MYVPGHVLQAFNSFQPATQRKIIKMKRGMDWIFKELLRLLVGNFFSLPSDEESPVPQTYYHVNVGPKYLRERHLESEQGILCLSMADQEPLHPCRVHPVEPTPRETLWLWKGTGSPERKESLPAFGRMDPPWIQQQHSQQARTDTASFTARLQRSWNQNWARGKGMLLTTVCQYSTTCYLLKSSR